MTLQFRYAARSDVGRVRAKNDDSAYIGRFLAVVADGMGGHVGGDVASASTVLDLAPLDHPKHADPSTVLADEIQSANLILNDLVHTNPKLAGMGTTCTALLLDRETLHLAHIGDSRAYRLKDGVFEQITKDHTFVQRLIDEGRLDPSQAESHPHKNVLMRVLGDVDASPELDVASYPAQAGERWLLCSDGLMAVVADDIIENKLRSSNDLEAIVDELVELTLAGGSPDNVTITVFEIEPRSSDSPEESQWEEMATTAEQITSMDAQERISAALLRQDLSSRPHLLVGAAQLATDTDQIPIVTRSSTQKRANTLLHGAQVNDPQTSVEGDTAVKDQRETTASTDPDASETDVETPRGRNWPILVALSVIVVLFIGSLAVSWMWLRGQYYVGVDGDNVAIYQGVPQNLGPVNLSSLEESTDIPLARLPGYTRQRVESGLPAQDIQHAQEIIGDLESSLTPDAPPVANSNEPAAPNVDVVKSTSANGNIRGVSAGAIGGNP